MILYRGSVLGSAATLLRRWLQGTSTKEVQAQSESQKHPPTGSRLSGRARSEEPVKLSRRRSCAASCVLEKMTTCRSQATLKVSLLNDQRPRLSPPMTYHRKATCPLPPSALVN